MSNPNGLVEIIRHGRTNIVVAILDKIWDVKPPFKSEMGTDSIVDDIVQVEILGQGVPPAQL